MYIVTTIGLVSFDEVIDMHQEIFVGDGVRTLSDFYTAINSQVRSCVSAFGVEDELDSISVQFNFSPPFSEETGVDEEIIVVFPDDNS
tara:strand:+ start:216 stop:479 length:264 start_codon:yes stop_codon:yes gene_type:complete